MEGESDVRTAAFEAGDRWMTPGGFCGHTYEKYLHHWIGLILRPLFPLDARIETGSCFNDPCLWVDWDLPAFREGLPKRSRRINLIIEAQALDDYIIQSAPEARMLADMRLKQFVENKLKNFHSNPDPPGHGPPGGELWVVTPRILQRTG